MVAAVAVGWPATPLSAESRGILGEEIALLTAFPNVPPAISRDYSTKVVAALELTTTNLGGSQNWIVTGSPPEMFVRICEGDELAFQLVNRTGCNQPRFINVHAVTASGSRDGTVVAFTDSSSQFTFKSLKAGLYSYDFSETATGGNFTTNGSRGFILVGSRSEPAPEKCCSRAASSSADSCGSACTRTAQDEMNNPGDATPAEMPAGSPTQTTQLLKGRFVYAQACFPCHREEGRGVPGQIPPLARSDFLSNLTKEDYIRGVLLGRNGPVTVNGIAYNVPMVPLNFLSDDQIANVLTYVRNSFGNSGDPVSVEEVARVRQETKMTAKVTASQFE